MITAVRHLQPQQTGRPRYEPDRWSVLWARGAGCEELAQILADGGARPARSDLRAACLAARADFLVQRRLTSFSLVSVAVPYDFHQEAVGSVVAAVGGGPHSVLAACVARKIGATLGVAAAMITVSRSRDDDTAAEEALERVVDRVPGLGASVVRERSAEALVATLPQDALLIVGAPGGSWVQRQLVGPGHQLRHAAPGGAIVVRSADQRCFQQATPGVVVSPYLRVGEARRIVGDAAALAVVADGLLVGIVRREALQSAPIEAEVAAVAEEPVFVLADDPLDAVADLRPFLNGAPVPVVDNTGRWLGSVDRRGAHEPLPELPGP